MAACRSVRARCSRSSVMSSVRLSLTLRAQLGRLPSARRRGRPPAPRCRPAPASAASVSASWLVRLDQRLLGAALGVGDGGDLGFGLARLPLHGGQHVARLRQLGLRLAPQLAQAALLGLGRAQALGGRLGCGARGLGGAARCASWRGQRAEPAALGQPAGGGRRRLARRRRSRPSATGRPRARRDAGRASAVRCRRGAVGGGDDADLAQAARQLGRARRRGRPAARRLRAGPDPLPLAALRRQCTGASSAAGASRSSPSAAASAIS